MAFPEISFLELMIFGTAISAVDPVSVNKIKLDISNDEEPSFAGFGHISRFKCE